MRLLIILIASQCVMLTLHLWVWETSIERRQYFDKIPVPLVNDAVMTFQNSRYSDARNLTNVINRGLHVLTATSGCHMARWVYHDGIIRLPRFLNDCLESHPSQRLTSRSVAFLKHGDTIYVTFSASSVLCSQGTAKTKLCCRRHFFTVSCIAT